jgi:hypothetical protein
MTRHNRNRRGSPVFIATFADGVITRMTIFTTLDDLDVERGKKLARHAYKSRTGKLAPAFMKAHFEKDGEVLEAYSAIDLNYPENGGTRDIRERHR